MLKESNSGLSADNRRIWEASAPTFVDRRVERILEMLPRLGPDSKLLDVGCLEGSYTRMYADRVGTESIHGVDIPLLDPGNPYGSGV